MEEKLYSVELGGKTLTATFNNLAAQAHGSVVVTYGETVVLATAVMDNMPGNANYFPLSVEYEEKFYAAGQILGSQYMRREGRPSDEAILTGRAIDRTIRPLFDQRIRNAVQVVITVLSLGEDDPDVPAIIATSLALGTSDIPWSGPIGAVRVGKNDTLHVNPTYAIREESTLDLLVCGKNSLINMIECGGNESSEDDVIAALSYAETHIATLETFQQKIIADIGKQKRALILPEPSDTLTEHFNKVVTERLSGAVYSGNSKTDTNILHDEWVTYVKENLPDEDPGSASDYFDAQVDLLVHKGVLEEDKRPDGRALDEVRPLFAQAGSLAPKVHGLGIFYRGKTHILSALTLGGPQDSLILDGMEIQTKKRFMHHYNFPPFSVGETGRVGGFNRRMIGHGALAEKALRPVLPSQDAFPYTIRVVSEALSSNGSTSMGSVCGATLALMDGGVPISAPVAGIAMGLITDGNKTHKVLTDIQGPEDHYGDMDLKVAGTEHGITAMQMDVKVNGVPSSVLTEALHAARKARLTILEVLAGALPGPRKDVASHAPHINVIKIKPSFIGLVIGSGGKTINLIKEQTNTEIDLEDDGTVYITGNKEGVTHAREFIEQITKEYHVGERFEGTVTRIADFGAFVKIGGSPVLGSSHDVDGLVHISEIAPYRIGSVHDALSVGDTVPVIVKEIDEQGRINLSIKGADKDFAEKHGIAPAPQNNDSHGREHATEKTKHPRHGSD